MTPCTTWTQPHTPVVSACPSWGLRSPTRCRWCTCPHQPLHLLVEHAIQRLEERGQLTWDEDDDDVRPPLEVGNEIFVSVALEVVQYQDTWALLDDSSVVRTELPALRDLKGAPERHTSFCPARRKTRLPRGGQTWCGSQKGSLPPFPGVAGGTNGVPLKRMRSGTFLPSAMTAKHSMKRSFSFPGAGQDTRREREEERGFQYFYETTMWLVWVQMVEV